MKLENQCLWYRTSTSIEDETIMVNPERCGACEGYKINCEEYQNEEECIERFMKEQGEK